MASATINEEPRCNTCWAWLEFSPMLFIQRAWKILPKIGGVGMCVACSSEPLDLTEMFEFTRGDDCCPDYKPRNRGINRKDLRAICGRCPEYIPNKKHCMMRSEQVIEFDTPACPPRRREIVAIQERDQMRANGLLEEKHGPK